MNLIVGRITQVAENSVPNKAAKENGEVDQADSPIFFERYPWIPFLITLVSFLPAVFYSSQVKLLWHDELFTYYIAQAPSLSALITLTRTLDLNPPLNYLIVRGLFHLLPASPTVCRIPSMAGFVLCMWCLYSWTQRRFGVSWGVVSALILATCADLQYSLEARPYGLMLGFVALGFVGCQRAADRKNKLLLSLVLIIMGGFGALLSHVFAIFAWMMICLAEVVRVRVRKEFNWPVALALLCPLIATAAYVPLVRTHAASYFPVALQASLFGIGPYYISNLGPPLLSLIWVVALTLIFARKPIFQPRGPLPLSKAELTALLGFFSVPAILIVYLAYGHGAFFERYGIVANIAIAGLLPIVGGWLCGGRRTVAWLAALVLFVGSPLPGGMILLASHPNLLSLSYRRQEACEVCELARRVAPALPFVAANGLTYIEMDNREDPQFLSRVFYLTYPVASIRYAHANIFEGMAGEKNAFPIRANVQEYSAFVRQHPTFLVFGNYDNPEDWLLRKLEADGAHLCLLGVVSDPQFMDRSLWHVELSSNAGGN